MAMSLDHQRTSEWARRLKRELKKAGEKARGLADALADVEASGLSSLVEEGPPPQ